MNPFPGVVEYLGVFRRHIGRRLYIVLGLAVVASLAEGIGIALLVPLLSVLDAGAGRPRSTPRVLRQIIEVLGLEGSAFGILVLIGLLFLFKGVVVFSQAAYSGYLQAQLLKELKVRMFDAYSRMSYPYYIRRDTGHFINVITAQIHQFFASFRSYKQFLTVFVNAVVYVAIAVWLTWKFAAMAMVVGVVVVLSFRRLNQYVHTLSRKVSRETSHLNKLLVQVLQSFKYLVSTQQIEPLRKGVTASIDRMTAYRVRTAVWAAATGSITEPITVFALIVIVIVQLVVLNQPLAPILVAIFLFHRGLSSIIGLQKVWQTFMSNVGSLEMVEDEFDALEGSREQDGELSVGPLDRELELRDVSFQYDRETGDVLRGVTMVIPARTTVAVVGESGAGKSTLVDLLTLLLKPREGEVLIDGVPGSEVKLGSWRSQIGYVSQETVVFDDTIAANIALRDVDEDEDPEAFARVVEAAHRAYLHHYIDELPSRYDTVVGDRGIRLSGGQRQRLFIARELYKQPNLLILDEATSALDSESERYIQESIDRLKGSMTVVIIAHRLSTIRNADHVYVLDRGRLIEHGAYDDLVQRSASRFREMVELQQL